MELPVVIFVSAVTGALSSLVVNVFFRKLTPTPNIVPPAVVQNNAPAEPPNVAPSKVANQELEVGILEDDLEDTLRMQPPKREEETEEIDEANILTSSDLSHHVPKLGRFKDLNIPSIDDDSIQVSDVQIPNAEEPVSVPEMHEDVEQDAEEEPPAKEEVPEQEPLTVPEHDDIDDDATVLVHRTPPK